MKVSIVISAYNEEKRIDKTLPRVIEYCREFRKKYSVDTEIVIVDDGSKDGTYNYLKKFEPDIRLFGYKKNMGKGHGLREGVKNAQGDFIYLADADFSTPIEFIDNFYNEMDGYDCVIGSRAKKKEQIKVSFIRKLLGNMGNLMIRVILGLNFKDTQCGFKMFRKEVKEYFLDCKNERFGYDFEFLYLLSKNGKKIKDIPVKWDEVGDSRVKPLDYFKTIKELIDVRRIHG